MASDIVTVALTIGIAFLIYKLCTYALQRAAISTDLSKAVLDGIKFALRVIFIIVVGATIFVVLGASIEQIMSFSTISGIIIGFASTEVVSQIVSGLYLILAGPFDVGELVNISGIEGIVSEIGMGYTHIRQFNQNTIKIPNKMVLDSKIKNYTLKMTDALKKRALIIQESSQNDLAEIKEVSNNTKKLDFSIHLVKDMMGNIEDFMFENEITRYVFDVDVDLGLNSKDVLKKLEDLCDNYTEIFNYKPVCFIVDIGYRATFRFRIYCTNARIILNNYNNLLSDITNTLYKEEI